MVHTLFFQLFWVVSRPGPQKHTFLPEIWQLCKAASGAMESYLAASGAMESEMESREPLNPTTAEQGENAGRARRLEELEVKMEKELEEAGRAGRPGLEMPSMGTRMLMPKTEDGLKWEEVVEELKSLFKFNADSDRGWSTILKTSLIILSISVLPSFFDMGSDALSVYSFINGTTYTKYIPDLNHSSFNSSLCTHVGTYLRLIGGGLFALSFPPSRSSPLLCSRLRQLDCSILDPIGAFLLEDALLWRAALNQDSSSCCSCSLS